MKNKVRYAKKKIARKAKEDRLAKLAVEAGAQSIDKHKEDDRLKNAPHTFVINRGVVGKNVNQLVVDVRKLFEPFTASRLKVNRKNVLKDFVGIAGLFSVTHLVTLSRKETNINLRFCKLPRGPTLSFKVCDYTLIRDIRRELDLSAASADAAIFNQHPLVIINGLTQPDAAAEQSEGSRHIALMSSLFQTMFPPIQVNKAHTMDRVRRCVLVNYDKVAETVSIRHYRIKIEPPPPAHVSSRNLVSLAKSLQSTRSRRCAIPDLSRYRSVEDFVRHQRGADAELKTEIKDEPVWEMIDEDEDDNKPDDVETSDDIGKADDDVVVEDVDIKEEKKEVKPKPALSGKKNLPIKLTEIGPRLTLQLYKIEGGLCSGPILHHAYVDQRERTGARRSARKEAAAKKVVVDDADKVIEHADRKPLLVEGRGEPGVVPKGGKVETFVDDKDNVDDVGKDDCSDGIVEEDDVSDVEMPDGSDSDDGEFGASDEDDNSEVEDIADVADCIDSPQKSNDPEADTNPVVNTQSSVVTATPRPKGPITSHKKKLPSKRSATDAKQQEAKKQKMQSSTVQPSSEATKNANSPVIKKVKKKQMGKARWSQELERRKAASADKTLANRKSRALQEYHGVVGIPDLAALTGKEAEQPGWVRVENLPRDETVLNHRQQKIASWKEKQREIRERKEAKAGKNVGFKRRDEAEDEAKTFKSGRSFKYGRKSKALERKARALEKSSQKKRSDKLGKTGLKTKSKAGAKKRTR